MVNEAFYPGALEAEIGDMNSKLAYIVCFRLVQLHNRETLIQKTKTHSQTRRWIGLNIRCEKVPFQIIVFA